MGKALSILIYILFSSMALAQQKSTGTNQLAISQGISSPTTTHMTLFSNGFTFDNPVGTSYQNGYHMTGSVDGASSSSFGLDFGVGDTQYGFAIGAYSNGCDGCASYIRGNLSAVWGVFGLGFGVQDSLYTIGMLFNPYGMHRLGIVAEYDDPDGIDNNRSAFGLGYAFVINQFSFALDVSKQTLENDLLEDSAILVSPGIAIRVDMFSVSLSYDAYTNDVGDRFSDQVWVGIGVKPFTNFEFKFYGDYVDRWTIQATWLF